MALDCSSPSDKCGSEEGEINEAAGWGLEAPLLPESPPITVKPRIDEAAASEDHPLREIADPVAKYGTGGKVALPCLDGGGRFSRETLPDGGLLAG